MALLRYRLSFPQELCHCNGQSDPPAIVVRSHSMPPICIQFAIVNYLARTYGKFC